MVPSVKEWKKGQHGPATACISGEGWDVGKAGVKCAPAGMQAGELEIGEGASIGKHPASPLVPWVDNPSVRSDAPRGNLRQGWGGLLNPTRAVVVPEFKKSRDP